MVTMVTDRRPIPPSRKCEGEAPGAKRSAKYRICYATLRCLAARFCRGRGSRRILSRISRLASSPPPFSPSLLRSPPLSPPLSPGLDTSRCDPIQLTLPPPGFDFSDVSSRYRRYRLPQREVIERSRAAPMCESEKSFAAAPRRDSGRPQKERSLYERIVLQPEGRVAHFFSPRSPQAPRQLLAPGIETENVSILPFGVCTRTYMRPRVHACMHACVRACACARVRAHERPARRQRAIKLYLAGSLAC